MTPRTAYLLAAGLVLASCLATQASEPELIQKVYPVADLVVPVENGKAAADNYIVKPVATLMQLFSESNNASSPKPATLESPLMKLIVGCVAPDSWAEAGGKATIDYFPLGMALVVSQTADVHEQIAALLASLRQNTDKEVGVEVRVVSIGEEMAKELQAKQNIDCFRCAKDQTAEPQVSFLDDCQVFELMEMLEGDRTAEVMQAPKVTAFNGQATSIQMMDYQWFVTDVNLVQNGGQIVFVPKDTPIPLGWHFGVQPVVSSDEKEIRVHLDMTFTNMPSTEVPLFPITRMITPVYEGGAQGQPIPFTQFVQRPCVSTWTLNHVVNVPNGATAVLSGWKVERETEWEGPPVLSQIPYVKELFRQFTTKRESRYMLVLVTPHLVKNTESEETSKAPEAKPEPIKLPGSSESAADSGWTSPQCPLGDWRWSPAPQPVQPVKYEETQAPKRETNFLVEVQKEMAALLVRKYHEACQRGLTAEAKCIAEEALELDPTCFSEGDTHDQPGR